MSCDFVLSADILFRFDREKKDPSIFPGKYNNNYGRGTMIFPGKYNS